MAYAPPPSAPATTIVTITAAAGALRATASVTVEPGARAAQLLALGGMPLDVAVAGGWVFWSDDSEEPVKAIPTGGGTSHAVARRVEMVSGLAVRSPDLVWLDLRDGVAARGRAAGVGALEFAPWAS